MPIFDRSDLSKLGNWMMDAEHRQLVVLMNEIESVILAGKDESEIRSHFDRLIACASMHFSHEDDSMARAGYPERDKHMGRHRELLKALGEYAAAKPAHELDRKLRALDTIQFLEQWAFAHAEDDDASLAAYLARKGRS